MKKRFLKMLAVFVLVLSSILLSSSDALAADVYYAAKGTAVIDAKKDESYDNSMTLTFGKSGATSVKAWALWDEHYIYVFAEVYDKTPVDTPDDIFQPWNSDSIEIFVNRNGNLTPSYEDDDFQYRIDINGNMSGMNKSGWGQDMVKDDLAKAKAAAQKTETGYTIEYAIPLESVAGQDGVRIGFDMGVNNCDIQNSRTSLYCWGGGGNAGPNGWKTLEMRNKVPEELKNQVSNEVWFKSGQNVALNRVAYMSAIPAWGNYPVNAVDGDESSYAQSNEPGNTTFTLDLGYSIVVDKINLLFDESNYPSEFKLEISSDNYIWKEFKNVWNVVGGQKVRLTFDPVDFRYLRMTPTKTVGDGELYGYALRELEVLSAQDQVIVLEQTEDNDGYAGIGSVTGEPLSTTGEEDAKENMNQNTKIKDKNATRNWIAFFLIIVLVLVLAIQILLTVRKNSKKRGETNVSEKEMEKNF